MSAGSDQPLGDERPEIAELVGHARRTFETGVTRPLAWRREQLLGLRRLLDEEQDRIAAALAEDLGKSPTEAYMTEIGITVAEVEHFLKHIESWVAPRKVKVPVTQRPGRAEVVSEPLGTALIISPWNYPIQLMIAPLIAALAAGNTVVAKPSELSPASSALLAELLGRYVDPDGVIVVQGGPEVAEALLAERFDHIFFTGSTAVGRKVMAAAAAHLTPVTLELGGKSPAIVHRSANLPVAARRIALGRFINAGQTCVAPDYLLVDEQIEDELVDLLRQAIRDFFGEDPRSSADYGRIVNLRHVTRLRQLLDAGGYDEVVVGGEVDPEDRYVAPTLLRGVAEESAVMSEEIFGPILPLLTVRSIDEAVGFVNAREKPLALYVFAEDDEVVDHVVERTSSGGVCVNHTLMHLAVPDLPFGGVGESGTGMYHGRSGFDAFSHQKSVLRKSTRPDPSVMYPPYGRFKSRVIRSAL